MSILFDRLKNILSSPKIKIIAPLIIIITISIVTVIFSNYLLALNQKQTSQTKAQTATVTGTPSSTIDSSSLPYVSQDYNPTTDLKNPGASSGGLSTPKTCSFGGNGSGGCGKAKDTQWGLRNPDGTAYKGDPKNCSSCSTGIIKDNPADKTNPYASGVVAANNAQVWAAAKTQSATLDAAYANTAAGRAQSNAVRNDKSSGSKQTTSDSKASGGSSNSGRSHWTCFISGTKILMADGTEKSIENIVVGEKVKSYNETTKKIEDKTVLKIASPIHDDMIKITFSDGTNNTNTFDHPYLVKNKGWSSYFPEKTLSNYGIRANKLEKGDIVYKNRNNRLDEITIASIKEQWGETQTYNLNTIENNHTYFANGILVHNKYFVENNASTSAFLISSSKGEYVYKKSDFYIDSINASISAFLANASLTQTPKSFILGNPKNNDDYIYKCYLLKNKTSLKCNTYSDILILSDANYFCCPK